MQGKGDGMSTSVTKSLKLTNEPAHNTQKIQEQRAQSDAQHAAAQKKLVDLKKECAAIGASTTKLLTELETEKTALQRAQKTLSRTKAQVEKQLSGAKAMVSGKQAELATLQKQASDLKACISDLQSKHAKAEASIKACTTETESLSAKMQQEEAGKKKAVLQAFDRKQEVETIKAQIVAEKVYNHEGVQCCSVVL